MAAAVGAVERGHDGKMGFRVSSRLRLSWTRAASDVHMTAIVTWSRYPFAPSFLSDLFFRKNSILTLAL